MSYQNDDDNNNNRNNDVIHMMMTHTRETRDRTISSRSRSRVAKKCERRYEIAEMIEKELNDHNQRWVQGTRVFERRLGNDDSIGIGSYVFCIASDRSD